MIRHKPLRRFVPLRATRRPGIPLSARAQVVERAQGLCEFPGCGRFLGATGGHHHHVLKRSQGGRDVAENLRWLCPEHHEFVESHPAEAVRLGLSVQLGKVA